MGRSLLIAMDTKALGVEDTLLEDTCASAIESPGLETPIKKAGDIDDTVKWLLSFSVVFYFVPAILWIYATNYEYFGLGRWDQTLPGLDGTPTEQAAIGSHFA